MIPRTEELDLLKGFLDRHPVVGIIGARQVGKTTLTTLLAENYHKPVTAFDLENPEDLARLSDPMLALKPLKGLVILDEIQRRQDLFPVLRVLADRKDTPAQFLILGSTSPKLLRESSESLAGRIYYHQLGGFSLQEVGSDKGMMLWRRGGFPRSFLAGSEQESMEWRRSFINNFIERDIPQLGITVSSTTIRRFWTMLAHYNGQVWNSSEFARSFGVADTTIRNYLDILSSALVVRMLQPWHENIKKRQVKSPKIYILDSGLLHGLLNLPEQTDLESHFKVGASWEGFIIEQIIRHLRAESDECFFWATHAGAELDLMIVRGSKRRGFEIKRTSSPSVTPSMRSALSDLKLSSLEVIHAGEETYKMSENIVAVSAGHLTKDIDQL